MTIGPGKYDDLCTYVREQAEAQAAIVIIINGNQGMGFSVQAMAPVAINVPDLLELIAKTMREDTA